MSLEIDTMIFSTCFYLLQDYNTNNLEYTIYKSNNEINKLLKKSIWF